MIHNKRPHAPKTKQISFNKARASYTNLDFTVTQYSPYLVQRRVAQTQLMHTK